MTLKVPFPSDVNSVVPCSPFQKKRSQTCLNEMLSVVLTESCCQLFVDQKCDELAKTTTTIYFFLVSLFLSFAKFIDHFVFVIRLSSLVWYTVKLFSTK